MATRLRPLPLLALTATALISIFNATISVADDSNAPPAVMTRWAHEATTEGDRFWALPHPRPLLCRPDGVILDGLWDSATTDAAAAKLPSAYPTKVLVPFSIGSPLSRVPRLTEGKTFWYRRTVKVPPNWEHRRPVLYFNAVDGKAVVYVNGKQAGESSDGAFSVDLTDFVNGDAQEIVVGVTGTSAAPCDGIWQTVWMEPLPADHIDRLQIVPDVDGIAVIVPRSGDGVANHVEIVASDMGSPIARAQAKPGERLVLKIPSIKKWSPGHPFLYDLTVTLFHEKQKLDQVTSTFGVRNVEVGKDEKGLSRILLNGKFEFQAGVIDAGLWPDGGASAPTDKAQRRDIAAVKQLGFNLVRKTGKVDTDFYYYYCDRLGVLVWQDVPPDPGGAHVDDATREKTLRRLIEQRGQHPSIIAWVVGGSGASKEDAQRDAKILKAIDPTRIVISAESESIGDVDNVGADVLNGKAKAKPNRASVIADLGSVTSSTSSGSFTTGFVSLWENVKTASEREGLSAAVYRELTDVADKNDGLQSADRTTFKIDLETVTAANKSPLTPRVKVVLPTARFDHEPWVYTEKESEGWKRVDGDFASWPRGSGPFTNSPAADANPHTAWASELIFVRREFTLGLEKMSDPWLIISCTGEADVFINDRFMAKVKAGDATDRYVQVLLDQSAREGLKAGRNVIAVQCRQPKDRPGHFLDFGLVDFATQRDGRLPEKLAHWPILDTFFRDTNICLAKDGNYYLTGTTGDWGKQGIEVWKSADLKKWEPLGFVWTPEKNASWQLKGRQREKFCMWAPEIHFMKGTFWIPYCTSYPENANIKNGTGLLKSTSGKAEGPYVDISPDGPITEGLDATLFEDDDGAVYFLHGGSSIARMKDDMSGLAEKSHDLRCDSSGVGFEGITLFKRDGKYYWSATEAELPDRNYDCFAAFSDTIDGIYHTRHLAISHGGHNSIFKDKQGQWWSTIFGGDQNAPFVHRPGLIPIEFAADGTIHPVLDGSR